LISLINPAQTLARQGDETKCCSFSENTQMNIEHNQNKSTKNQSSKKQRIKRTDCSGRDRRIQPAQNPAGKHMRQTAKYPNFQQKNATYSLRFSA